MGGKQKQLVYGAGDRIGKYEILKRLAVGGMAEVYLARVMGLMNVSQIVVLKRILPEFAGRRDYVQMFLDEARIAATLQHPNIVQMYDMGSIDGNYFIVLEHLHGEDARNVIVSSLQREGRMPLPIALHIAIGLASGLHYAHEKVDFDGKELHIVHRDVTPQNVIVTYDGNVKLLDFGVAQADNRYNRTRGGVVKGKLSYMSPEQCLGKRLDRRSDVFSLGIMLYELTLCRRLFFGNSDFEILKKIVEDPMPRPSEIWPEYPPELERIVEKCLAREVADRYQTAQEVQVDLEAFARSQSLPISNTTTKQFMHRIFGERVDSWRREMVKNDPPLRADATNALDVQELLFIDARDADEEAEAAAAQLRVRSHETVDPIIIVEPAREAAGHITSEETTKQETPPRSATRMVASFRWAPMMGLAAMALVALIVVPTVSGRMQVRVSALPPLASADPAPDAQRGASPPMSLNLIPAMPHFAADAGATRSAAAPVTVKDGMGRLELSSEIPVEVMINGVSRGQTPLKIELPTGTHIMTVRSPTYSINRSMSISIDPQRATRRHLEFDTIDL